MLHTIYRSINKNLLNSGDSMQQPDSTSDRRTQPALPGGTLPTTPVVTPPAGQPLRSSRLLIKAFTTELRAVWSKIAALLCFAILIELCLVAIYPLFVDLAPTNDLLRQALPGLFSWLPHFYWTAHFSFLQTWLNRSSWFAPLTDAGRRHLVVLFIAVAFVCMLLATLVGRWIVRKQLSQLAQRMFFWVIVVASGLFSVTLLFVPVGLSSLTQEIPLYGFYGRLIAVYHANPYLTAPAASFNDIVRPLILGKPGIAPYGPVWLDLCLLIALLAQNSIANLLLDFRLLGLIAHLANVALLWFALGKLKPQTRVAGTLLYAWNPLMLLFSVVFIHQEVVIVLCLLLATLFFQRESPTLGWVLLLLVALINSFYFLLLPVFFRMLLRESRILYFGRRLLWWLGIACITLLVVMLAYAPYWQGWGIMGMLVNVGQTFLPSSAANSLDYVLLHLPVPFLPVISGLVAPVHWALFVLLIELVALLLAIWLADTLPLALLFSCWLLLIAVALMPIYWPWYVLPPLALALCAANRRTIELVVLLTVGALFSIWYWLMPWPGQGLVTLALPLLVWGWMLFFISTWRMMHAAEAEKEEKSGKRKRGLPSFSRPSWLSRPSRPGRG
jgi:hypothetical protein